MHYGVDVADGTVEADLIEVIVAAGVVQVEQAAIFQRLRDDAVGDTLSGQVLQYCRLVVVVVCIQVELLVLEAHLLIGFQRVVVAVRAEHDLSVVEGEDRVEVGVPVVGDLLQGIGE